MNGKLLVGDGFGAIYFYNPFRERPLSSTTLDGASHLSNDVGREGTGEVNRMKQKEMNKKGTC